MVNGNKVEDRLEGSPNFFSWKPRILIALEENDFLEHVNSIVSEPSDEATKAQWKKNKMMARKIMIDFIKDNLIPVISKLESTKEMFDTLKELYEINNTSKALALRNQLLHIKMSKGEFVVSYFMNTTELKDQLAAIC